MEVLSELTAKGVGCVLVVADGGALLGTFTDGDLRRALQGRGAQARARGACLSAPAPGRAVQTGKVWGAAACAAQRPLRSCVHFPIVFALSRSVSYRNP